MLTRLSAYARNSIFRTLPKKAPFHMQQRRHFVGGSSDGDEGGLLLSVGLLQLALVLSSANLLRVVLSCAIDYNSRKSIKEPDKESANEHSENSTMKPGK